MSSINDFELAQRIHIATVQLQGRIAELEAERDRMLAVIEAAKAIDYEMFNGMTPSLGSVNKLKSALAALERRSHDPPRHTPQAGAGGNAGTVVRRGMLDCS